MSSSGYQMLGFRFDPRGFFPRGGVPGEKMLSGGGDPLEDFDHPLRGTFFDVFDEKGAGGVVGH